MKHYKQCWNSMMKKITQIYLIKGRFPACWFFSFCWFSRMCGFFDLSVYEFPSQCGLLDKKIFVLQRSRQNLNCKFSLMACKTSLFLLNKINYFYLHWFMAEKSLWSNKGKERCDFELASSKSLSSQFWFSFMQCCCCCWFICCCCCCCCCCCSSCPCCCCCC